MPDLLLKSLVFKKKFRCFDPGFALDFRWITLLVGDQGCGKSTLITSILDNKKNNVVDMEYVKGTQTQALDTEKDNPRMKSLSSNTTANSFGVAVASRFGSHGEMIKPLVLSMKNIKNKVVFIDEPESGLSIRTQYKVLRAIKKSKSQLVIATHSPILMEGVGTVFNLETREWMSAKDFISTQK